MRLTSYRTFLIVIMLLLTMSNVSIYRNSAMSGTVDFIGVDTPSKGQPTVTSSNGTVKTNSNEFKSSNHSQSKLLNGFVGHAAILIDGNADFASQAALEGWEGNGTHNDPYIIQNYQIAAEDSTLLTIRNVDAYFIVTNCYFVGQIGNYYGIWSSYSGNGSIINNIFTNLERDAIYITDSEEISIANNTITETPGRGIKLRFSELTTVINNTITESLDSGIQLQFVTSTTIVNNTISHASSSGIDLHDSQYNLITNNTIQFVNMGIDIRYLSDNNTIKYNVILHSFIVGLQISRSTNNTIIGNRLQNSTIEIYDPFNTIHSYLQFEVVNNTINGKKFLYWRGKQDKTVPTSLGEIFLVNCSNIIITDQYISQQPYGVQAVYCDDLEIYNNVFSFNKKGIVLDSGTNASIATNNIFNNNSVGVFLKQAKNNTISNNKIYNSSEYGIEDQYTTQNTYCNNTIRNTRLNAIYSWESNHTVINSNTVTHSGYTGISTTFTLNCIITNNNASFNADQGIDLYESSNALLDKNLVAFNQKGIDLGRSQNLTVLNNFIAYNVLAGLTLSEIERVCVSQNNFIHNYDYDIVTPQARGSVVTIKNVSYNYWSDHTAPDDDQDGIVDTSYYFTGDGNTADTKPVTSPYHIYHFIDVPTIIYPDRNVTLSGEILIEWEPALDYFGHSVTYTIEYSHNAGKNWTTLATGITNTNYTWDTTGAINGHSYLIRVKAICSEGHYQIGMTDELFGIENDFSYKPFPYEVIILLVIVITLLVVVAYMMIKRRKKKRIKRT